MYILVRTGSKNTKLLIQLQYHSRSGSYLFALLSLVVLFLEISLLYTTTCFETVLPDSFCSCPVCRFDHRWGYYYLVFIDGRIPVLYASQSSLLICSPRGHKKTLWSTAYSSYGRRRLCVGSKPKYFNSAISSQTNDATVFMNLLINHMVLRLRLSSTASLRLAQLFC